MKGATGLFVRARFLVSVLAAFSLDGFGPHAVADTERPVFDDYDTQMKGSDQVGTLGPTSFGDHTDLYTGATTFLTTDVSLPGNSDLPVAFQRSLAMYDDGVAELLTFAWSRYEVPYLSGIYASDTGWQVAYLHGGVDERCSAGTTAPEIQGHDDIWESSEYFHGNHLYLPGRGQQPMSFTSSSAPIYPTDGRTYHWATQNHWRFSCLPTTKNGQPGEGFLAVAPDGKKYYFDWLVSWRIAATLRKFAVGTGVKEVLQREEFRLLLTRVEDRFGNWVNYTYSGKDLISISANDGRELTITYVTPGGNPASVTDGSRTWTFGYQNGVQVTFPDASTWRASISGPGLLRVNRSSCSDDYMRYTGEATLTITHRTGAMGTFAFRPMRRGLSHVYYNPATHPCPQHPKYLDNIALHTKVISGPGLTTHAWSIIYGPPNGCHTWSFDACTTSSPVTRYVDVVGPGGAFSRATFGNKWRDSEGALQRLQVGTSISNILRDTSFTWETIPAVGGAPAGGGYLGSILRLEKTKTIQQDGVTYTTTNSAWDEYHNPQTISESGPNGGVRTTQYTYYNNKSKWVIGELATSSSPGSSIVRTFDANGNLTSSTVNGVATSYTYHPDGNVATIAYPRSLVHSFSDYKLGIAQSESKPEAVNLTRVVNDFGFVTSEIDGEGRTRSYTHDSMGRITAIDYPRGNDATIVHMPLSKTVTRGSLVEETTYDALRRTARIVLGGVATTYQYDAYGRRVFESNPGDTIGASSEYDALGRLTRVTNSDSTFKTYSYSGYTVVERDERNNHTTTSYRRYGDPGASVLMSISAADPAANVSLERAANDQVLSVTQAGLTRSFSYDSRSYLISETNPETGTTTYGRDAAGNMTSRTIGGVEATFAYDGLNRLIGVSYSDGTPPVTQSYSKTGRLNNVSTPLATRVMSYDANDNLTSESLTAGSVVLGATYAYSANDQLSSITYPISGRVVSYAPDVLGRPTQVSGYVNAITYWPSGLPRQLDYANGIATNYEQDARLWPSGFSTRRGGVYYADSSYSYDGAGNLIGVSDAVDTANARSFSYDDLNRLTGASGPWGSGALTYDGAGNITSQNLGLFSLGYQYDSQNRLTNVSGSRSATYAYDGYGNISAAAGTTYLYDGVPNLRCVDCATAERIAYAYDGTGKRVSVTKAGMTAYEFHSSAGNLLAEYTPSQGKLVEYIHLAGKRIAQRISDQTPPTPLTPVATALTADQNNAVTLDVTVGGASPTGSVKFVRQGNLLGAAFVTGGRAAIEVIGLAAGTHTVTATYSGDAANSGNSITYQIQVTLPPPNVPASISVPSGSTTGSYTISWGASSGVLAGYELYEATNSGFSGQVRVYSGAGASMAISGRSNGAYYYRVRACNASACSGYRVGANATTVTLPPGTPASIGVPSGSTTGSYTITWGASSGTVTAYRLYEATSSSFSGQVQVYSGTGTSMAVSGRGNGAYYYRVRACNVSACSSYRTGSNATTVTLPPSTPASISVPSGSTTGSYTISWGASSGTLTAYKLYEATNSSFSGQVQVYSGTGTSVAVSGRGNGVYYYRVRACHVSACSGYRTGGNSTAVTLPPGAPTSISVPSSNNTGSYTLSWGASTGTVTAYRLYEATNSSFSGQVQAYSGVGTSAVLSGRGDGAYYYRVRACNVSACSSYRTGGNSVTVLLPPSVPSWISVPATNTSGTYTISWGASTGELTSYQLYEATNPSFSDDDQVYGAAGTSITLSNRTNGTYYYRVRACNSNSTPGLCGSYRTGSNGVTVAAASLVVALNYTFWNWTQVRGEDPEFSANVVVTASGGVGGYEYAWERVSGDYRAQAINATSASTGWDRIMSDAVYGVDYVSYWRCKVTDDAGTVVYTPNVRVRFREENR